MTNLEIFHVMNEYMHAMSNFRLLYDWRWIYDADSIPTHSLLRIWHDS